MTGFGEAELVSEDFHFRFEIKSVNYKKLEIFGNLPAFFQNLDQEIRNVISAKIQRGKINFYLKVFQWKKETDIHLNKQKLDKLMEILKTIHHDYDVPANLDFRSLLSIPDVVVLNDTLPEADENLKILIPVIEEAVNRFNQSRQKEGNFLHQDILKRIDLIKNSLQKIIKMKEKAGEELRSNFEDKMNKIFNDFSIEADKNRLYQELAYLIDKADIQEEITRLQCHIEHFQETLLEEKTSGKKINFIIQEMAREANTLGVKSPYMPITHENLIIKEEIEKIKEQIQNVE